jgi:putative nucleotidyltransferase with HDIG domain
MEAAEAEAAPPPVILPTDVEMAQPSPELGEPPSGVPFQEELRVAKQVYREAKLAVEQAMHDVRMGKEINTEICGNVVEHLADSVLRNPHALTSLSRLKSFDQYTFFHSVNTSILAMTLGYRLGFERDALHLLGMGALLHDVGKMTVPLEILNKPGRYRPDEYEIMKQHALRGAEILNRTSGMHEDIIRPALEHHERADGTGYPFKRRATDLSQYGLISGIVDVYDAITSDRVYHKAIPAHRAVQFIFALGQRGQLDTELVQHFVRCVGIYPVGSCVKLNTREIALVKEMHPDNLLSPVVLIIRERETSLMVPPLEVDLANQWGKTRTIEEILDPREYGIRPTDYLD